MVQNLGAMIVVLKNSCCVAFGGGLERCICILASHVV